MASKRVGLLLLTAACVHIFIVIDGATAVQQKVAKLVHQCKYLLSIGGLLLCCLFSSVPGTILGWIEVSAIKEGRSSPKGMTMAQIGLWGGLVVTLLNLIFYGIYLLMILSAGAGSY